MIYHPDYEGLILERQDDMEIWEDEPDSPYFGKHTPEKMVCDECTDKGHCPEYQSGAVCVTDRGKEVEPWTDTIT